MGKKEKDKTKKYDEIRAIVREEMERVLQELSINVQLGFNTLTEEGSTTDIQEAVDQKPVEEQVAANTDVPVQEKT